MTDAATVGVTEPGTAWQPPLGLFGHAWRIVVCAVAGVALASTALIEEPTEDAENIEGLFAADLMVFGPSALLLLAFHRRHPMGVALAVSVLSPFSGIATVAELLCLVSIAARRRAREITVLVGFNLALNLGLGTAPSVGDASDVYVWVRLLVQALVIGIACAAGMYLGARRDLLYSLRLRAEQAEREQALRAEQARTQERVRIAREMHDVLAHRISLLSMHAGALGFRDNLSAEQIREESKLIQHAASEALSELRGVLGTLRAPDGGGAEPPQPLLADLDRLVEEARSVGTVEVARDLDGAGPPDWLGRHAYRIVQEALTNARKHAPGATVRVELAGRPGGELAIRVENDGPGGAAPAAATGAGLGLIGLAERATAAGGLLDHAPTPGGGYRLTARLPWPDKEVR